MDEAELAVLIAAEPEARKQVKQARDDLIAKNAALAKARIEQAAALETYFATTAKANEVLAPLQKERFRRTEEKRKSEGGK